MILTEAERAIGLIKRKLFRILRHDKTSDWVTILPEVVESLNSRKLLSIGFLEPREINHSTAPLIELARESLSPEQQKQIPQNLVPDFNERVANVRKYLKRKDVIKPGNLVFVDYRPTRTKFLTSYEVQRHRIAVVTKVDPSQKEVLFKVKGLLGEDFAPFYLYRDEIKLFQGAVSDVHFELNKVKKWRKEGNKEFGLVSMKGYSALYDTWLAKDVIDKKLLPSVASKNVQP